MTIPATWLSLAGGAAALALAAPAGPAQPLNPAIERGAEIAQDRCSICHAVALEAASPSRDAPQFRVLSRLYSAEDLRRKLADISENGHFEMPPIMIRDFEVEDVAAYIASLDGGAVRPPPRRGSGPI